MTRFASGRPRPSTALWILIDSPPRDSPLPRPAGSHSAAGRFWCFDRAPVSCSGRVVFVPCWWARQRWHRLRRSSRSSPPRRRQPGSPAGSGPECRPRRNSRGISTPSAAGRTPPAAGHATESRTDSGDDALDRLAVAAKRMPLPPCARGQRGLDPFPLLSCEPAKPRTCSCHTATVPRGTSQLSETRPSPVPMRAASMKSGTFLAMPIPTCPPS